MKLKDRFAKIWLSFLQKQAADVKLADYTLEDGKIVSINDETMDALLIVEGADPVPVPIGEHKTQDGKIIVVVEEGKVSEVKDLVEASKVEAPAAATQMSEVIKSVQIELSEMKAKMAASEAEKKTLLARITELEKQPAAEDIVTEVNLSSAKAKPKHYSELLIKKLEKMQKEHPSAFEDSF